MSARSDSADGSLLTGRVAIVTGAGRGLGRAHALALARHGAAVVVNDLDRSLHGDATSDHPAEHVVAEIEDAGGRAVSDGSDVSDFTQAAALVKRAIDTYGRLDVLVNNAGVLRDRTLVNMTEEEWDTVIRVHLRGTFAPLHFAAEHWRERHRTGETVSARVINTTSTAGLFAFPGQGNYGAAKAGIAALSQIAAKELARYGVTVNAIAPAALTRMTENLEATRDWTPELHGPAQVGELVAWLASEGSSDVTGQVVFAGRGRLYVARGWQEGDAVERVGGWTAAELGELMGSLAGGRD